MLNQLREHNYSVLDLSNLVSAKCGQLVSMFVECRVALEPFWHKMDAKINSGLKNLMKLKFPEVSNTQKVFRALE